MRQQLLIALLLFFSAGLSAQTGGDNTFEFLNLSHSAFAAATGGVTVSQSHSDLSTPYFNPALLDNSMRNTLSLNYSRYFADINYGYAAWALGRSAGENWAGGISYVNYGSFTAADEAGTITGTFRASEYAFNIIYSRQIDSSFTAGINIKPVYSVLERYTSAGICADLGVTYNNPELRLAAGMVIKNAGVQLKTYTGVRESLPFEIQAGVTKSLAHAPFRFTLTLRHLEKFDLTYDYDTGDDIDNNGFGEDLLRHIVVGAELVPGKNFWAGAGFNYQRRAEMRTAGRAGAAGLSFGFGFRARSFALSYGRDTYHLAGAANHFSLMLYPDIMFKNNQR